ncbi:restriction endonuclease subunit S [Snodgrassella sp. CFCC 13594]|uniref:restriction endonuclease subunit S n=1 Tax=Snodgrassella sp. CFCC 13594 TaxID=1775559 RepID=UPI00082FC0F1|nr:restriction endonuclease subunit S [Snodgrassella sp. CFCC 13594]
MEFEKLLVSELLESGDLEMVQDGNHGGSYPEVTEFVDSGIPLITGACISNGRIDFSKANFLTEARASRLRVGFARVGDVLLSHKGTMGKTAIVPELSTQYLILNPQLTLYRVKRNGRLNNRFLKYYFDSSIFQGFVERISATSTINTLSITEQRKMKIPVPPLEFQNYVADVVGVLDDKIDLNRRINQTLEAMAQAIFKSWFVDFDPVKAKIAAIEQGEDPLHAAMRAISGKTDFELDQMPREHHDQLAATATLFPDAVEESELGEIPKGWEINHISQFGSVVCGKTPSKANPEYFGIGIPFIKIPDMHNSVYVINPSDQLSALGSASQAKKTIPAGSICVSCIATVGKVVITHEPSQTNQQINTIVPNFSEYTVYLYFQMREKEKEFHDLASGGSATLNMNTSTFSKVSVLMPNFEILGKFSSFVAPLFSEILSRQKESAFLSEVRDTLLPKLLSGELSVDHLSAEAETT